MLFFKQKKINERKVDKIREEEEHKKTRRFFTGIFIDEERLKENNINYPIRLEYYKITNEKEEYGIEVVKTEYRKGFTKIENEAIINITKEENIINNIIYKLKENLVTPIGLEDTVTEILECF